MLLRFVKALQIEKEGGPLLEKEVKKPTPGDDEVLVEMKATSLCGSDLHHIEGETTPGELPVTLGHEGAGVVAETGKSVENVNIGDNVIIHYILSCGTCEACALGMDNQCENRKSLGNHVNGTFADYICVPSDNALVFQNDVPFEWASVSSCAVSTAYHALQVADIDPGDDVIIFGAGGVGLHAVLWSSFFGAGSIVSIDLIQEKLSLSKEYGATDIINPSNKDLAEELKKRFGSDGVDIAIECSGSNTAINQALGAINGDNLYSSGKVVSVGLQTSPFEVEYWGLREGSLSVSGDHTRSELLKIIKLMESGRIDLSPTITHKIPFENYQDGIELLKASDECVGRVVLEL
jgi:D-arabinose 1-dehydrogenase-like Zn-dependent alcohol dehydrogenase